jgi:Domain of unknown function (DUF4226)
MSEQAGSSVAALRARQAQLANHHDAAADADRILTQVLVSAHAATREGLRRLDAIADEIESAVSNQQALALETPLGAKEFQRFLLAKHREISAIVEEAREVGREKKAQLDGLRAQYGG